MKKIGISLVIIGILLGGISKISFNKKIEYVAPNVAVLKLELQPGETSRWIQVQPIGTAIAWDVQTQDGEVQVIFINGSIVKLRHHDEPRLTPISIRKNPIHASCFRIKNVSDKKVEVQISASSSIRTPKINL